jgi:hypothetical protein
MNTATESETNASAPEVPQPKTNRAKKAKLSKKLARAKKPTSRTKTERVNKKAEVIGRNAAPTWFYME